jgi:SAM-dependent methyltransferase
MLNSNTANEWADRSWSPAQRAVLPHPPLAAGIVPATRRDSSILCLKGMDKTTRRISDMYEQFPYPSSQPRGRKLKELVSLLKLFCTEAGYDLRGKSVLDAGTGTGQRLIEAAAAFPDTRFTAVDISDKPLAIARQAAAHEGVRNVEFHLGNLMQPGNGLGTFDVVLSMGVVHHLSDPAAGLRNIVTHMAEDGVLFLYIYGHHGGRERMRRKQIVSLLLNGDRHAFDRGISLVRDLQFDTFDYGWNLNFDDEDSRNALIVDAYLNVNEKQFEAESIFSLMKFSGLYGFLTYGVTLEQRGALFDTRLNETSAPMFMMTDIAEHLPTVAARKAYESLSLADRYRLIDLFFQPNGYTLLGLREASFRRVTPGSRIAANMLRLEDHS